MACNLGMNGALYIGTAGATAISGMSVWSNVANVSMPSDAGRADVTTRDNNGWRSYCSTLKDLSIDVNVFYKASDTVFTTVRNAYFNGTVISVAMISAKTGAYEGLIGDFVVTSFSWDQSLEEGQQFNITFSLNDYTNWLSATHGV